MTKKWLGFGLFTPWLLGVAVGFGFGFPYIGGGIDAFKVFLTDNLQTVPPWVHILLKPVALLGWPYSYGALVFLTVLSLALVTQWLGGRWWLMIFSAPVIWEILSGQVEWMAALGVMLALIILEGKARPAWFGLALALMLSKPWVSWGAVILLTGWMYRQFGWKGLRSSAIVMLGIVLATFALHPDWFLTGAVLEPFALGPAHITMPSNGSIWPWGAFSWLFVLGTHDRQTLLRRVLAASLLTSPFLHLYHVVVLTAFLADDLSAVVMLVVGWLIVMTRWFGYNWSTLAWVYPLTFLAYDWMRDQLSLRRLLLQRA